MIKVNITSNDTNLDCIPSDGRQWEEHSVIFCGISAKNTYPESNHEETSDTHTKLSCNLQKCEGHGDKGSEELFQIEGDKRDMTMQQVIWNGLFCFLEDINGTICKTWMSL